jgi:3D (Asp-Asp-Asp) domain-containing protein
MSLCYHYGVEVKASTNMKNKLVAALWGCFVYGGLVLVPAVAMADTLDDMTVQLQSALITLKSLQATGGSTTDSWFNLPETVSLPEPTYPTYSVTMTAYNAVPGQTDDTPEYTSIGAWTNPEIIAARSRDLADELPYGTVIAIMPATTTPNCGFKYVSDQVGLRVIGDAMHERMRNKIDILMDIEPILAQEGKYRNPAKAFGFCRGVEIAVVGKIEVTTDGKIDPKKVRSLPKTQLQLAAAVGLANLAHPQLASVASVAAAVSIK